MTPDDIEMFGLAVGGLAVVVAGGWAVMRAARTRSAGGGDASPSAALQAGGAGAGEVWKAAAPLLPARWGTLSAVPAHRQGRLRPVAAPYAQALVHGAAAAAPALHTALRSGHVFRMIGPPAALDGLANGTLGFQYDKAGLQLMNVVDGGGTIRHQPRVVSVGAEAQGAATAACAFQVLSVATAQYYLHQINAKLESIEGKVSELIGKLEDRRVGMVVSAARVVNEVDQTTLAAIGRGTLPQQLGATSEFWSRMANAERDLRAVIAECEAEYTRKRAEWQERLGDFDKVEARWVRRNVHVAKETPILSEIASTTSKLATLYLSASAALFRWYQVVLAHDAITDSRRVEGRYAALRTFVSERAAFLAQVRSDESYMLANLGEHPWDTTKDLAAASMAILIIPVLVAANTDDANRQARRALADLYAGMRNDTAPIAEFESTREREFYLQDLGSPERPELLMLETDPG